MSFSLIYWDLINWSSLYIKAINLFVRHVCGTFLVFYFYVFVFLKLRLLYSQSVPSSGTLPSRLTQTGRGILSLVFTAILSHL